MSEVGARMVRHGQVALILGSLLLGRRDVEAPGHVIRLKQMLELIEAMSLSDPIVPVAHLSALQDAVGALHREMLVEKKLPTGERDWSTVFYDQSAVRRQSYACAEMLFTRSHAIWGRVDLGKAGAA